ncbi:hypothetical protein V6N11_015722 [Hibiscus sabdariffa]|uniref:Uncharacterized protein n=1 Tax=Hibiscus sabdariffa TaxID=183260 RepID=A0ABR2TT70_9ROSI
MPSTASKFSSSALEILVSLDDSTSVTMADHLKLQLSLQESSVPDIPKTGIEQSLQGSRVLDIPKTETKIETLVSMDNFTLATMADDMKLFNNHCRKAVLLTSQKSKLGYDYFPAPLASLERPDLRQEPSPPESPEGPDLWREQRWKDILSKEERRQQCPRCKEIGHGLHHCPYPVCYRRREYPANGLPPERKISMQSLWSTWTQPPHLSWTCFLLDRLFVFSVMRNL